VEHPCNRCGAAVDNNSPFCPACEAPQIRFEPREAVQDPVRLNPGTVPPAPVVVSAPGTEPYRTAVAAGERRRWLRASIYAGAIGGLLSIIPGGFLLGVPLSGVLAIRFYRNGRIQIQIPRRQGFLLGALAGVFASGIFAFVSLLSLKNPAVWQEFTQELGERIHRAEVLNPDPQLRQFLEYFLTQQGTVEAFLIGTAFVCVALVLVAGSAGMVSASIANRRSPQ